MYLDNIGCMQKQIIQTDGTKPRFYMGINIKGLSTNITVKSNNVGFDSYDKIGF